MAITVKDVAKKAGVATSTVSRVINDHPSISESTKKKVRKVMDDLGYVPNMTARTLGKRISSAIGVILPPLDSILFRNYGSHQRGSPSLRYDYCYCNCQKF